MKTIKIAGMMVGAWLALGLVLGAPLSRADERRDTVTAPSFQQQKEEYQRKVNDRLNEFSQELKGWKRDAKRMERRARAEMDDQLGKLNRKEDEASRKLKELRSKSGKAWEDFRGGMDSAMDDLERAFDNVRSRFKSM